MQAAKVSAGLKQDMTLMQFNFFWDSVNLLTLFEICFNDRCLESLSESESLDSFVTVVEAEEGNILKLGFMEETGVADVLDKVCSELFSSAVWNMEW